MISFIGKFANFSTKKLILEIFFWINLIPRSFNKKKFDYLKKIFLIE